MSADQINVRIAQALGDPCIRTVCTECWGDGKDDCRYDWTCSSCDGVGVVEPYYNGANYYGDLNACAKMELILNDCQIDEYKHRLNICITSKERITACATAPQRCEAFLRTVRMKMSIPRWFAGS